MRIDKISVENFRLFEKQDFSFHPQFNLIVGVNGSGKSSLLRALLACISGQMLELGVSSDGDIYLLQDDDVSQKIVGDAEIRYERIGNGEIEIKAIFCDDNIQAREVVARKNSPIFSSRLVQKTLNQTKEYWPISWSLSVEYIAPMYIFYGCNRLWQSSKNEKIFENAMTAKYSRRDGYKDWASAQADSNQLVEWLLKQNIIAFQEGKESLGWRVLNKALKNCFEGFEKLSFMAKEGDLVVHDIDDKGNSRRKLFKHMSDGQRCMIGLIGDMVRRAVLLNPQLGDEILEKTAGVVLIDELDLHLHPTWQRRIIDDLKTTFPKVQFICTTHSPQLIGQAKADEIILLGADSEHPPQSYGMDSNWILRHIMGSDERDASVKEQLDDIFEYIEDNQFDEAENEIKALRAQIGESSDLPDLQEAEALITRYSRFDDAEDK